MFLQPSEHTASSPSHKQGWALDLVLRTGISTVSAKLVLSLVHESSQLHASIAPAPSPCAATVQSDARECCAANGTKQTAGDARSAQARRCMSSPQVLGISELSTLLLDVAGLRSGRRGAGRWRGGSQKHGFSGKSGERAS